MGGPLGGLNEAAQIISPNLALSQREPLDLFVVHELRVVLLGHADRRVTQVLLDPLERDARGQQM